MFTILRSNRVIGQFLSVPQQPDILRSILIGIAHHNGCSVLRIQLHGTTDAVGLFTGHERAAAAAEQIQHDAVWCGTVLNGVENSKNKYYYYYGN